MQHTLTWAPTVQPPECHPRHSALVSWQCHGGPVSATRMFTVPRAQSQFSPKVFITTFSAHIVWDPPVGLLTRSAQVVGTQKPQRHMNSSPPGGHLGWEGRRGLRWGLLVAWLCCALSCPSHTPDTSPPPPCSGGPPSPLAGGHSFGLGINKT